eukprot:6930640-Prymnesium_polylepis.1
MKVAARSMWAALAADSKRSAVCSRLLRAVASAAGARGAGFCCHPIRRWNQAIMNHRADTWSDASYFANIWGQALGSLYSDSV